MNNTAYDADLNYGPVTDRRIARITESGKTHLLGRFDWGSNETTCLACGRFVPEAKVQQHAETCRQLRLMMD